MPSAHALLGASSAERWITCPPSARLTEGMKNTGSSYTEEGTLAHTMGELLLRIELNGNDGGDIADLLKLEKSEHFSADMPDYVQIYVDTVLERYYEALTRSKDAIIRIEERLDYSHLVPDGFGTGDAVIIADGLLEVIDLKYGKNPRNKVESEGNAQMKLYALGALEAYSFLYDIKEVRMTIVQPRLDHISESTMTVKDLLRWGETVVRPAAELAFAGKGEFHPCEKACRWCLAKATCKARGEKEMEALSYELRDARLYSNDEIASILSIASSLKSWASDVESYAQEAALRGEKFEGWKLVEGRSNRKIVDPQKALDILLAEDGISENDALKPRELKGLTDLERAFGKSRLGKLLKDLIQKPPGKPVLVPSSDKRPELNSVDNDFKNEEF